VGGVSGRTSTKAGGIKPFAGSAFLRVGAVKGILVVGKTALFAECRRNEGLDRSVRVQRYPPLQVGAPVTADVRRTPRRGTPSALATKRCTQTRLREIVARARGGVLHSVLRLVFVNPHYAPREQSSVVGRSFRYRRWANSRKREEPSVGPGGRTKRDSPRLTVLRKEAREAQEKEGDRGLRPCEDQELGFGCPHVVT